MEVDESPKKEKLKYNTENQEAVAPCAADWTKLRFSFFQIAELGLSVTKWNPFDFWFKNTVLIVLKVVLLLVIFPFPNCLKNRFPLANDMKEKVKFLLKWTQ